MTDTLHQEPERDQFKSESPIRAFTNWTVQGRYALGKGFRPSLAHVIPYLNAMETKEGWQIVQVLEADTQTPSFLFRQSYVVPDDVLIERLRGDEVLKQQVRDLLCPVMPEIAERTYEVRGKITLDDVDAFLKEQGLVLAACPDGVFRMYKAESDRPETYAMEYFTRDQDGNVSMTRAAFDDMPDWVTEALPNFGIEPPYIRNREGFEEAATKMDAMRERAEADFSDDVDPASRDPLPPVEAIGDDPINPKHYAGRECADIGERLSANGYQILKYCWRLGKKDDPCQELGKALWYGESESELLRVLARAQGWRSARPNVTGIKDPAAFLEDRIADQPQFTQNIARMLWAGYSQRQLQAILEAINEHRFHLDCGRGLAI